MPSFVQKAASQSICLQKRVSMAIRRIAALGSCFRRSTHTVAVMGTLALTACARPFGSGNDFELKKLQPNPSGVVAAEIAFNREAREEGLWTAFRELAADDAIMLVPEAVNAKEWLKDRTDPATAPQWEAEAIYMSCDGRTAASKGGFINADALQGYFTTIWQRRYDVRAADADWKFLFDHGGFAGNPRPKPEFVQTRIASCNGSVPAQVIPQNTRMSRDGTLKWTWNVKADTSRIVTVSIWNGSTYETVIQDEIAATAP